MKIIKLSNGGDCLVDDENFDELNQYKWVRSTSGYASRQTTVNWKPIQYRMHRVIMKTPRGMETDHINGNRLDNQKSNLRICTKAENHYNKSKSSTIKSSQFKGVYYWKRNNKWKAQLVKDKKSFHLGTFDTEHQAALAYDLWAKDLHGEFAKLNFQPAI